MLDERTISFKYDGEVLSRDIFILDGFMYDVVDFQGDYIIAECIDWEDSCVKNCAWFDLDKVSAFEGTY